MNINRQLIQCFKRVFTLGVLLLSPLAVFASDATEKLTELGLEQMDQGNFAEAVSYFDQAIQLDPDDHEVIFQKGLACFYLQDFDQAILTFFMVIQLDPEGFINSLHNRGELYTMLGYYDLAIADYTRETELDPQFADAYYFRGLVYAYSGDMEKANADYEMATQLGSDWCEPD